MFLGLLIGRTVAMDALSSSVRLRLLRTLGMTSLFSEQKSTSQDLKKCNEGKIQESVDRWKVFW